MHEVVFSVGWGATRLRSCYSNCLFCGVPKAPSGCQAKPKTHTHTQERKRKRRTRTENGREKREKTAVVAWHDHYPSSRLSVSSRLHWFSFSSFLHPFLFIFYSFICLCVSRELEYHEALQHSPALLQSLSSSFIPMCLRLNDNSTNQALLVNCPTTEVKGQLHVRVSKVRFQTSQGAEDLSNPLIPFMSLLLYLLEPAPQWSYMMPAR